MNCRKFQRKDRPAVRRRATRSALAAALVLFLAAALGSTSADEPAIPKDQARARRAKRPPNARVQTTLALAKKSTAEFRQPEELAYRDFNELSIQVGNFDNPNAAELGLPAKFQLLCYNGRPVGPTIRVRRGRTFHVHLKNDLPAVAGGAAHVADGNSEQPHDLCTTNLHTHGLHVSPAGNGDNVFVDVKPQEDFTFEYDLPADHPAGTFWYHPHRHGSVAYQLSNGLAGALIVEGSRGDGIPDLEDIPEIAAARERILVLQLYNYRVDPPGPDGVARVDANTIYDVTPDARTCSAISVPNQDPTEKGQATAINGVINPVIRIAPGEVQRWRLIHAAWDVDRRLYLGDDATKPAADFRFYEIALDGLATGTLSPKGNDPKAGPAVEVAPGQRSDVLLQAPLLNPGENERVYYLLQSEQPHNPQDPPATENLILAKVLVTGRPRQMRLPDPRDLAKCQPFANIRDEELATKDTSELVTKGLNFLATTGAVQRFWINGKTYSQYQSPVQIRLNTAEEWKVTAKADNHPFHIHVNPFQVVLRTDANGGSCTPMSVWRDTLFVRQGETYTVRSRFTDFLGKTVIHCHFLDHEDQGMMMPIEFIPPYQTPKPAAVSRAGRLRPDSTAAPDLRLADAKGAWHRLADFRPHNVLLIFFQGLECGHCTEQLGRFVREAGTRADPDTVIVAVSARRVADPDRALKAFGVTSAGRFCLLVDEEHRAFRAFGCYDNGPLHGLFVIDRGGTVRARYAGEVPFDDTRAVAERMAALAVERAKVGSQ